MNAALQARELGANVTLLEAAQVGGTNLNRGPAPVRTLARAARLARDWSSWSTFGLEGPPPVPNLSAILANSERVARYAHEKKDVAGHLRRNGVNLQEELGPVRFIDPHTLAVDGGDTWSADRIILAVGGHAGRLLIPGADLAFTYEDIPSLTSLPRSAAVVGGADTGCQIASILDDFGVSVSLFEAGPVLLPAADASVSAELGRSFRDQGMTVHTDTLVEALGTDGGAIRVDYRSGPASGQLVADAVFFAVGWPANVSQLALEAGGVHATSRVIPVDDYLRTNVEHVFAVGDVNGRSKLVQSARIEGRTAAWNAVHGPSRRPGHDVVPSGSFTDPEYGSVGLSEERAARDHDIAVGIAWYDDLLRPVADGNTDGFCKLIADRNSHAILGAHVLGGYSAETVQVVAVAMRTGMDVEQLAEMQFAYPTFTEAVSMAAQKACHAVGIGRFPPAWSYLGPTI